MQLERSKGTGERKLYTGLFPAKVIAINPDRNTIAALYGGEADPEKEEMKYEGKAQDGTEQVQIVPWVETLTPEKIKFRIPYYITDKPMIWSTSKKPQFVNCIGEDGTADCQENLQNFFQYFTKFETGEILKDENGEPLSKQVRQAIDGEAAWYKFLRPWLSKVKFNSPATNILFNKDKLFRNVDKYIADEYRPHIAAAPEETYVGNIVILAYVVTKDKDGQLDHKQKFWTGILPPTLKEPNRKEWTDTMKLINMAISTSQWMRPNLKDGDTRNPLEKWYEKLTDENGITKISGASYDLQLLHEWTPDQHQQSTNEVFRPAQEDGTPTPINDSSY